MSLCAWVTELVVSPSEDGDLIIPVKQRQRRVSDGEKSRVSTLPEKCGNMDL